MTEGPPPGIPDAAEPQPDPTRLPDAPAPRVLGLTTFALEGRRAPALFVIGWVGTLLGLGLSTIGAMGGPGSAVAIISVIGLLFLSVGLSMLAGSQTVERRAAGATYAGPSPVLVFLAVVATSRLVGFVLGSLLQPFAASIPVEVGDLLAVAIQAAVFLGILRLTVFGPGGIRWAELGLDLPSGAILRTLSLGAVYAAPVLLIAGLLARLAVQLVGAEPPSPLPPTGTSSGLVLHLLAGALVAPVIEELFFRGFVLTAWRRTVGTAAAIGLSSLLFVIAHVLSVGGETFGEAIRLAFVAGVVRLPVALVLGWLYVRTGSLWAPIGLHAAYNAVLILVGELYARSISA